MNQNVPLHSVHNNNNNKLIIFWCTAKIKMKYINKYIPEVSKVNDMIGVVASTKIDGDDENTYGILWFKQDTNKH